MNFIRRLTSGAHCSRSSPFCWSRVQGVRTVGPPNGPIKKKTYSTFLPWPCYEWTRVERMKIEQHLPNAVAGATGGIAASVPVAIQREGFRRTFATDDPPWLWRLKRRFHTEAICAWHDDEPGITSIIALILEDKWEVSSAREKTTPPKLSRPPTNSNLISSCWT